MLPERLCAPCVLRTRTVPRSIHAVPMAACHRQPWDTCAKGTCRDYTPPRVGMTPSPFIFSLYSLFFLFGFYVFTDSCLGTAICGLFFPRHVVFPLFRYEPPLTSPSLLSSPLSPPSPPLLSSPLPSSLLYLLRFSTNFNVDAHKSGW